jgi:hypothetical protein
MTEPALELIRELVRADEAYSTLLAELDELVRDTVAVRTRADELASFLASAPSERARIDGEVTEAERDVHARARALSEAEAELAEAEHRRDEERLAAARRFVVRASDALSIAEKRAAATQAASRELERKLAEAGREAPLLEERAAGLATALEGRPRLAREAGRRPEPGLSGVAAWASGARATLLVARNAVATERDLVIRQANELGSIVLGEPLIASSAALVAQQVEAALRV